jgi:hypothetical protein
VALEYLFHCGEAVCVGRDGFRKVYDLAERALPPGLDLRRPDAAEMAAWYVDGAARSLGIFSAAEVAYLRKDLVEGIDGELRRRLAEGSLVPLLPEAGETPPWGPPPGFAAPGAGRGRPPALLYAAPGVAAAAAAPPPRDGGPGRAWVLSPFDPLLIDRRRARRLFGVEYQLECYLPEARRRFGYFALPLVGIEPDGSPVFHGLADARLDRGARLLELRRLALWRPAPPRGSGPGGREGREAAAAALAAALAGYARWQGAEAIGLKAVEAVDPVLGRRLAALLPRAMRATANGRRAAEPVAGSAQAKKRRTSSRE